MWTPEPNKKTLSTRLPQLRQSRRKHNIQGDIRTLLGKEFEVEKMIRFLREIGCLRKYRYHRRMTRSASVTLCLVFIDDFIQNNNH